MLANTIVKRFRLLVIVTAVQGCISSFALANESLANAAEIGDTDLVRQLLSDGIDADSPLTDNSTALHSAVMADHPDVVKLLLDAKADPNIQNRYGVTPIYFAAENGNAEILTALLEAGADSNTVIPTGESVLMLAAKTGKTEAVEVLLDHGASVDFTDQRYQQTALMIAARENNPEVTDLLIRSGADVNARTRVGPTPEFQPACRFRKGGCGSEGVGVSRRGLPDRGEFAGTPGGMTALLYAARDGHTEVVRTLLDAGAEVELADANNVTPFLAAVINNQLPVANLLMQRGANINADDFWGRTPLFAAVNYRNLYMNSRIEEAPVNNGVDRAPILEFIKVLLDAGADVNARTREVPPPMEWRLALSEVSWVDMTGQTPFLRAAESGDITLMRLLISYGADPFITTFAGTSALMAAAGVNWTVAQTFTESEQARLEAVQYCIELGLDVNASDTTGLTALIGAANRGSNDTIRLLVANGADLHAKDKSGRDARRWAEGVFLGAVGAEIKPETIALIEELLKEQSAVDQ